MSGGQGGQQRSAGGGGGEGGGGEERVGRGQLSTRPLWVTGWEAHRGSLEWMLEEKGHQKLSSGHPGPWTTKDPPSFTTEF